MKRLVKLCAIVMLALHLPLIGVTELSAAQQIKWQHLLPKLPPLKDPYAVLTDDQRFDIETIEWARSLSQADRQNADNQQALNDAKQYEASFKRQGLDVAELLAQQERHLKAVAKRQKIVNADLNNKVVRLAGYLLPLEFSDQGVRDFLLVPYLGACIHVPPPPPNQIVLVQLAEKFRVADLFTPAWVVGRIKTKALSRALTFVDGTSDIPIGYHIEGGSAEVYRD